MHNNIVNMKPIRKCTIPFFIIIIQVSPKASFTATAFAEEPDVFSYTPLRVARDVTVTSEQYNVINLGSLRKHLI